ncbi:hypothetical protein M0813_17118 [Anaeramoeba flamelloides]|uniref:Uncharacterized protein n=1 Tax=Anaeramoeba flamelloides TaxID=1746091 RepID=A0ABQ8YXT9_9EUKA|nr:hypothetical protein M0813_17118 [Anaeramoeba flamelloides]
MEIIVVFFEICELWVEQEEKIIMNNSSSSSSEVQTKTRRRRTKSRIGITFKLRPFNDLFEQAPIRDVDIPEEYLSNAQDIYSQLIEEDDDDDDLQDWEQGIPLPNYDAYGKVIAIENIGKDGDIVIGETELQEVEKKKNTKSKSESEK